VASAWLGPALSTLTRSRYSDNEFEYRHVQLPKAMLKAIPVEYHDKTKGTLKLLWEEEWRGMGITQVCRIAQPWAGRKTNWLAEPWLGALRGPRAGAPYSPLQVSTAAHGGNLSWTNDHHPNRRPLNYQPPQ
jgi:hypothetical protein